MGVCKAELFCPSPVYSTAVPSVKGVLWPSLEQESDRSRPGPSTFHTSEIRLNCVFAFSSRHRFRQWWEVRRQDPDSSYIVLYRHTTCPEATEGKKKTSWVQRRYFKRFNLGTEIFSMRKTVIVHKVKDNKYIVLDKASFPAAKVRATNSSFVFLQDCLGHV